MKKFLSLLLVSSSLSAMAYRQAPTEALNSFDAVYNKKSVSIKWVIEHPDNMGGIYTVERSRDGKHFEKVSEFSSSVSANGEVDFMDVDAHPGKKKSYYRLKFTDSDGSQTFSRLVYLEKNTTNPKVKGTYNKDAQGIDFSKFKKDEQILVVVRDQKGNEFYTKTVTAGSQKKLILDKEANLSKGEYLIVASSKSGVQSSTLIVD